MNFKTENEVLDYLQKQKMLISKKSATFTINDTAPQAITLQKLAMLGKHKVEVNGEQLTLSEYILTTFHQDSPYLPYDGKGKPLQFNQYSKEELIKDEQLRTCILHLQHLLMNKAPRFIDWLANNVQRMGKKNTIPYIPFVLGEQGNGKSTVAKLLRDIYTPDFVTKFSKFDDLENHNLRLDGRYLAICDDGRLPSNDCERNIVKSITTDEYITINEKYVTPYTVPNLLSLIVFGNDKKTYVESGDRRIDIYPTASALCGNKDYFTDLRSIINDDNEHYINVVIPMLRFIAKNLKPQTNFYSVANNSHEKTLSHLQTNIYLQAVQQLVQRILQSTENETFYKTKGVDIRGDKLHIDNVILEDEMVRNNRYTLGKITPKAMKSLSDNQIITKISDSHKRGQKVYNYVFDIRKIDEIMEEDITSTASNEIDLMAYIIENIDWGNLYVDTPTVGKTPTVYEQMKELKEAKYEVVEGREEKQLIRHIWVYENEEDVKGKPKGVACRKESDQDNITEFETLNQSNGGRRTKALCQTQRLLFECDKITIEQQQQQIEELRNRGIQLTRVVYSGNKSLHCVVELTEDTTPTTPEEYEFVWNYLNSNWFKGNADTQCKDNSHLTRMPNGTNRKTNKKQDLIESNNIQIRLHWRDLFEAQKQQPKQSSSKPKVKKYSDKRLQDLIDNDIMVKQVFEQLGWEDGKRNATKCHVVGKLKGINYPNEKIEEAVEAWLGDLEGENSIASLLN